MAIRDFYFIIGDSPLYVCTIIIIKKRYIGLPVLLNKQCQ